MSGRPAERRRRGQPLAVLAIMMVGWIGLRAALWEQIELPGLPAPVSHAVARVLPAVLTVAPNTSALSEAAASQPTATHQRPVVLAPPPQAVPIQLGPAMVVKPAPHLEFVPPASRFDGPRVAAAHQLAWMAGVAHLPVPDFVVDRLTGDTGGKAEPYLGAARPARPFPKPVGRWSADGWFLLRSGGAVPTAAGLPSPSYGASQAGAVLRYRLSASSVQHAALFLRASSAVRRPRGEEAALGVAARPLAGLPVALQAEMRATRFASGVALRPAIAAITELPRIELLGGLSAEAYGQAGLIGGADSTAFVDGQLRIEQRLVRLGRGELRVGLGSWGGAQKGASRLDVGPTATLDFAIGGGQGRFSADWRLRAAGNAAPQSGPAITLSAGF